MLVLWEDIKKQGYHSLVKFYLMSCYLYYEKDVNVLLDYEFDEMCKILLKNFDKIKHMHKHLLDKESLKQVLVIQLNILLLFNIWLINGMMNI